LPFDSLIRLAVLCCDVILTKRECDGVHTVAQPSWRRSVIEDMSEMRSAPRARNFHSEDRGGRAAFVNRFFADRLRETWPAGARIKLGCGVEQRGITANATVETFVVQVPVLPRKRHLGAVMAGDIKHVGRKLLPPFAIALHDLGNMNRAFALTGIGEFHNRDVLWFLVGQTCLGGRRMSFIHRPPYV